MCSETFPSGCLTLDFALGGGLPKGRIVEVTSNVLLLYLCLNFSLWLDNYYIFLTYKKVCMKENKLILIMLVKLFDRCF